MKNFRISTQINMHPKQGKTIPETITEAVAFHKKAGFDALDFPIYLLDFSTDSSWQSYVDEAHKRGMMVNPFTVDKEEKIEILASLGCDAIITNVPDVARRVLDK